MKIWYFFNVRWENFCALRSFKNIFRTFLLKIFQNHGFSKKFDLSLAKNP